MDDIDEKIFHEVSRMLQKQHVNFWVCHGTLLGIIREGRLLPWDHDIDFAVWESETTRDEIINIFTDNGYKEERVFGDMDCLHFYGENKKIDISFYKTENGLSSVKWAIPPDSLIVKTYLYCVQVIWSGSDKNIELFENFLKRGVQIILNKSSLLLSFILPIKVKKLLYLNAINFLNYTGYSYPVDLMRLHTVQYKNTKIQVPIDSSQCLELTYGKDWKIPRENYIWHEEAKNLINL